MGSLFDYLTWRGDFSFRQSPFGPVDSMVLSALAYVEFQDILPRGLQGSVPLDAACRAFCALPPQVQRQRVRLRGDMTLAQALIGCKRFCDLSLCFHREKLDTERQMQFSAMAVLLRGEEALVVFRGTDSTLVGWKEDFNMSFQQVVPAQEEALAYLTAFAQEFSGRLRVAGHSKGGNLAVYAASRSTAQVRDRVLEVYNHDGPGFWPEFLKDEGYRQMLGRIRTYVPESSVVGMILEREEAYTVVKSRKIGLFQHECYNWEVVGNSFVLLDEVSQGSRVLDRALKSWLAGLTPEQRAEFVDAIYAAFQATEMKMLGDVRSAKRVFNMLKALKKEDEETGRMISHTFRALARATGEAVWQNRDSEGKSDHRTAGERRRRKKKNLVLSELDKSGAD